VKSTLSHVSSTSRLQAPAFDALTRSLPRRGLFGLVAAALVAGGGAMGDTANASRRRRRKRGKRRSGSHGIAVSERTTSIPPNCIFVCCDGTCDSWKMCMKCVKWPKPTTNGAVLTQS
jgi:hypothetical protein